MEAGDTDEILGMMTPEAVSRSELAWPDGGRRCVLSA